MHAVARTGASVPPIIGAETYGLLTRNDVAARQDGFGKICDLSSNVSYFYEKIQQHLASAR
jgi:hypothetical protein